MAEITIHSNAAKRIMTGRKADVSINQYPILGINGFAKMAFNVVKDAKNGNPCALWYLLRLESRLEKVDDRIAYHLKNLDQSKEKGLGIKYPDARKGEAVKFKIEFATSYGWVAARYICQLDDYYYQSLTLAHVGLIKKNDVYKATSDISRAILGSFNELKTYQSFPVLPEDIMNKTEESKQAIRAMGVIPLNVLNGKMKPDYL